MNWNIQKGTDPAWAADLAGLTSAPDLMIFQEAAFDTEVWSRVAGDHYRSFAAGYRMPGAAGSVTGVVTFSAAEPLMQCQLVSVEPWLRSPKATMITEYGLTDTDQTLLVVNIHAINFAFGSRHYRQQMRQAFTFIDAHQGPVLLSGDFNTWNVRRSRILQSLAADQGLTMVSFDVDRRRLAFGQPLDHIYVRGLRVITATTRQVDSSDHNPMSASLSL